MLELIKKWTGLFLLLAVAFGFIFPFFSILKPAMIPLLMILLYCSFVRMKFKLDKFFRWELITFPLVCWVILPPVVYYTSAWLGAELQTGFLLAIITPPALASPIIVALSKGDLEYTVANVTVFNLLSPLAFAMIPQIFLKNSTLNIDYQAIMLKVVFIIFIPLIVALLTNKTIKLKNFVLTKIDSYKVLIQMLLIVVAVGTSANKIKALDKVNLIQIVLYTYALAGFLYLLGWIIARSRQMKFTLPVTLGHKNTLLTITIGLSSFSELTALPAVFYIIAHHTFNGIVISMRSVKKEKKINNY
ncbi:MAG: bile acid:sodium symporter [Candidatus Cloacimonadales bacterium]